MLQMSPCISLNGWRLAVVLTWKTFAFRKSVFIVNVTMWSHVQFDSLQWVSSETVQAQKYHHGKRGMVQKALGEGLWGKERPKGDKNKTCEWQRCIDLHQAQRKMPLTGVGMPAWGRFSHHNSTTHHPDASCFSSLRSSLCSAQLKWLFEQILLQRSVRVGALIMY